MNAGRSEFTRVANARGPVSLSIRLEKRPRVAFLLLLGSLLLATSSATWGQSEVDEYRLKAAFLFHFAQFVEWPPGGVENDALVFCVVAEDPFHGDLENMVHDKQISGKPVKVRYIRQASDSKECHLLFLDRRQNRRVREYIADLADAPVLTVGEADDFLSQGGMIHFLMEERKVRFEVNQAATEKAHLNVSARLLLLAKSVVGRDGR